MGWKGKEWGRREGTNLLLRLGEGRGRKRGEG